MKESMKLSMLKFYRQWDPFRRYTIANEMRVRAFKSLYSRNKRFFGNNILDVGCGGGVLGFVVEDKGHSYTGIDVNPDMVRAARSTANQIGSRCRFILGDARRLMFRDRFDTVTCIGNALSHFTSMEFESILERLNRNLKEGSYFVIDYRDTVDMLFRRAWKERLVETKDGTTKTVVTTGCSTVEGEIYQSGFARNNPLIKAKQTIWSPFILQPLMKSHGWKLVSRKKAKEWQGWLDIYTKKRDRRAVKIKASISTHQSLTESSPAN
jgi:ubiquinone/menaquinone biosynthesis C-methylase UbiE